MSINKNFIVKNGIEVAEDLIFAEDGKVGIGQTTPLRTFDVDGDLSFTGKLYAPSEVSSYSSSGTVDSVFPNAIITNTNTDDFRVYDILNDDSGYLEPNTVVTSIGNNRIFISPNHTRSSGSDTTNISIYRPVSTGSTNNVLVSQGDGPPVWKQMPDAFNVIGGIASVTNLEVDGPSNLQTVSALEYLGDGSRLSGIVTQIVAGTGIQIQESEIPGKGVVEIASYFPIGKTIFVTQNGDDENSGLTESDAKKTIKAAAAIAFPGDTIKVYPGVYVEENPIYLSKRVAVEGTELRNCVVTPKHPNRDLFYVNNSCHITDLSFIGPEMTNGSAIISLQPLAGVAIDRYFDTARMIRYNLDYIARESVGFLTSGFSGFAGGHREQDAGRLIDLNTDFIAAEAVGFITSTDYKDPEFQIVDSLGNPTDPINCSDDIKAILGAISDDLKAASNKKSIGAAKSYFDNSGALLHITGSDPTGYSVKEATIAAINHAIGIATHVINNFTYTGTTYSNLTQDTSSYSPVIVSGGCTDTIEKIQDLSDIITGGLTNSATFNTYIAGITTVYGVNLDIKDCADDVKDIWKCVIHDVTRGGNSRCVAAGKSYYDEDWNLIPQILKNPQEVEQTIKTLDYSFDIARAIINNVTWGGFPVGLSTEVVDATYDNVTGITTITATDHNLSQNDAVKIVGLGFTCPSDGGVLTLTYPTGSYGYIFNVHNVLDDNNFEVIVGQSTLPHTYVSGGTIQKYTNFQNEYTQVKDLGMQIDPDTGFNNGINGCANVVSALRSCVGVVTTIIGYGQTSGINVTYPGNSGYGFTSTTNVTNAVYDNVTGNTTLTVPGLPVKKGSILEVRDLLFECESGGILSSQKFPSGRYGYEFDVTKVNPDGSFVINTGVSTIPHAYVSGGFVVNRSIGVTTATYDHVSGITTITAPGAYVKAGDFVTLYDLEFTCSSGAGTTTLYPSGKLGYEFKVIDVPNIGQTFVVNTGVSTIAHDYVNGGIVIPAYSTGVGPITQGPYVRNCTNFVPSSIGMRIDGFDAEPGDQDDIGVTGTMSVDSYTQYNQGGIGVSITNGAYAQLVSIFTICDDIAIFTGSGGQCDLTNSNSSFGRLGLVADGVGDAESKSIYRYTGVCAQEAEQEQDTIIISGIGNLRPYDGQTLYFGQLYYFVNTIEVLDSGDGYTTPPTVIIDAPTGPNGIRAEASANIENGKVISVDLISTGTQYENPPSIQFSGGGGNGASAQAIMSPTYYTIESATLPSAGITTVVLAQNLNNTVSVGATVYFSRLSLQITSSHSFEWVGSGNDINRAKPALGGVVKTENEVVKLNGGEVVYTSTDQAGNFRIGDGIVINQITGTISGRAFSQSILNTVNPLIVALGN